MNRRGFFKNLLAGAAFGVLALYAPSVLREKDFWEQALDRGYIWAPYSPLYRTPTIILADFVPRPGQAKYADAKVNPDFYATVEQA